MKVKGPNGVVFDWPQSLVESLLVSPEFTLVKDEPKVQPKATPKSK